MALCKLEEEMVYEATRTLQDTVECTPTNGYNPGEPDIPPPLFFSLLFVYTMNCQLIYVQALNCCRFGSVMTNLPSHPLRQGPPVV